MPSKTSIFSEFRKRISQVHPDHRNILKGMISVAVFVFLGKLAGAGKEMLVAYRYGVSEQVDSYLFILNLVNWPIGIWFSILKYVLVPLSAKIHKESPEELSSFRSQLLGFTILLGINLTIIAWWFIPVIVNSEWLNFSKKTISNSIDILPWMVIIPLFGVLISLLSAWMLSSGRHFNTLLESVPSLTILISLLLLPITGIEPLIWGTVAGFILHTFSLIIPLARRKEIEFPRFNTNSRHWNTFWQGFGIMLIGSGLASFMEITDQFFAANLGSGSIATVSYANRVLALILGLGATAISRATLPVFSKMKSQGGTELHRVAMFWVKIMVLLGIITLVICWWLAPWMVKLLFERGEFTAENTIIVTEVFRFGLFQLPFFFPSLVLVTLLASHGKHKFIAISGGTNLFVKVGANFLLVPIFGIKGILLSTAILYMVSFFILVWFGSKYLKQPIDIN